MQANAAQKRLCGVAKIIKNPLEMNEITLT